MIPSSTTSTNLLEPDLPGLASAVKSAPGRPHAWHGNLLELPLLEAIPVGTVHKERAAVTPRAPSEDSTGSVLSAGDFDLFLTRESGLADRGTRHFSVMILQRRGAKSAGWLRLAPCLRERLRSTDLVGHTDSDRVSVLLTDTAQDGARIVADWVDLLVVELGIQIQPTIQVYPAPDPGGGSRRASSVDERDLRP